MTGNRPGVGVNTDDKLEHAGHMRQRPFVDAGKTGDVPINFGYEMLAIETGQQSPGRGYRCAHQPALL